MRSRRPCSVLLTAAALLAAGAAAASAAGLPYAYSSSPTRQLLAVAESGRSKAELVALDSLAGNLARSSPRLYRVASPEWEHDATDSYSIFLRGLREHHGVDVDSSLISASLQDIVRKFRHEVSGYVRCNVADASLSAAYTTAAAGWGILLGPDDATSNALEALGVPLRQDLRGKKVGDVLNQGLANLSNRVVIFQDPQSSEFLGDYCVFARAAHLKFGSEPLSQKVLLARSQAPGVALGWGAENEFVSTNSQHGLYVHASDKNKNLAALSNVDVTKLQQFKTSGGSIGTASEAALATARKAVHTVAFLMSDGDNLQWTLGPWSVDQRWFGSKKRGSVPMGWTLSPALVFVAPSALEGMVASLTRSDELIAGPSGIGYMFPTEWDQAAMGEYANLTFRAMKASGMRLLNVLGQGDDPPSAAMLSASQAPLTFPKSLLAPLLADEGVDGMFYYPWGGGYAALHGGVWQVGSKPVVSARFALWDNGTSGDTMFGVQGLVRKLKTMPKTPETVDGYSLIDVHAWSHTYDDVLAVATALEAAGGFEVVMPSELLRRIRAHGIVAPTPEALIV